ncbi:MAG: hypothetical protein EPO26_07460 [Chloroflexota bacterium]|nr:MAG: hypothetical protein EPO26_07460 [Chloroflexota bacterium]
MSVTCEFTRHVLLVPDGSLSDAASAHVATCPACASFARSVERVNTLAASVLRVEAPIELQARLAELSRLARPATLIGDPDVSIAAVGFGRARVETLSRGRARSDSRSVWSFGTTLGLWIIAATLVALAVGRAIALADDLWTFVGDLGLAFIVLATTTGAEAANGLGIYLGSLGVWVIVGVVAWIAGGGILRLPVAASAVVGRRA